jgi:polysaccharide export outer membrane protein
MRALYLEAGMALHPNLSNAMRFRDLAFGFLLIVCPPLVRSQAQIGSSQSGSQALARGDVIRILIWREPDLSGDFIVDEHGVVTLPMLGTRSVLNTPISSLRDSLIADYAVQLRNPSVTITPLRRIYVLGEVNKPGIYTVDPTISLLGAVGLAGGATELGDIKHLRVVRGGVVVTDKVASKSSLSEGDVRSEDQVFVERRGWLDRNSTFVASAGVSAVTLAISLILTRK